MELKLTDADYELAYADFDAVLSFSTTLFSGGGYETLARAIGNRDRRLLTQWLAENDEASRRRGREVEALIARVDAYVGRQRDQEAALVWVGELRSALSVVPAAVQTAGAIDAYLAAETFADVDEETSDEDTTKATKRQESVGASPTPSERKDKAPSPKSSQTAFPEQPPVPKSAWQGKFINANGEPITPAAMSASDSIVAMVEITQRLRAQGDRMPPEMRVRLAHTGLMLGQALDQKIYQVANAGESSTENSQLFELGAGAVLGRLFSWPVFQFAPLLTSTETATDPKLMQLNLLNAQRKYFAEILTRDAGIPLEPVELPQR